MEAMASGVPSIGTRIAGVPELIEDGISGLLVEPGSPEQLAEALRRVYEDPDLADRLARAGRQAVIDGYTISAAADRLERIFANVQHGTETEGIPV
jgi:glycosyltransferase involved in cell wall biosynthesis